MNESLFSSRVSPLDIEVLRQCLRLSRKLSEKATPERDADLDKLSQELIGLDGLCKWGEHDDKILTDEFLSSVRRKKWRNSGRETNQGRVTLRFGDFLWDYRLQCLHCLWKQHGDSMVQRAYEKALQALKDHWYSEDRTSVYVSIGGETEGVTYGSDIFLNAPHMLTFPELEIVSLVAHEFVHAALRFPEPSDDLESFVRLVMEEGIAVQTQLPFRPGSDYDKKWKGYMEKLGDWVRGIRESVQNGRRCPRIGPKACELAREYNMKDLGPAHAVGFAIISTALEERCFDDVINQVRKQPLDIWDSYISRVAGFEWKPMKFL